MIRTITKLLRSAISVSRVDLSLHQIKTNPKIDFFPIVGYRQQKLGACVLNQPANQNILTEQFVDELYRFILSYQFDHSVENVWIESKQSVFSHGLDYKRLTEDKHYIDKVARLAILFAKMNKPMFAQVAGGAKGAGAYLLSMITMPIGHSDAFLRIDDASRGMTPLLGGTHRMTRLPLHLGYYLALTCDELNFQEMTQIGYIKGRLCNDVSNSQIRQKLQEANLYFREKLKYTDFDESKLQQQQKEMVKRNKELYQSHLKYRQGQLISQSANNLNVKFAVNQHLAASSDYYNTLNAYNSFSQGEERHINNYYQLRLERPLEYLKKNKLVEAFQLSSINIPRLDLAKIDYIFAKGSLQEIMDDLKEEKSQWAQRAYQRMKQADPLALLLTFELLKKAENKPWIDCLENEFTVARRLIENSKLKLKTYSKSSQYVLINDYSNKTLSDIPSQLISSYLSPGEGDYKLQHDVSSHSLHPYSDYYQLLPDSVRKYLNREQFNDAYLNEQVPEVTRFLNNNKINYASQVYDVNLLRKQVFEKFELQKEKEMIRTRLTYLSGNDRFLSRYKNEREDYLEKVSNDVLDRKIKDQITTIFRSKFQQRFKDYQEKTASIIGLENKITLFKNIKKIILDNLLYNGAQYEDYQRNNTSYTGPIYFDKQGKDIFSSTNPHINADPALNQLTKDLSKGLQLSEDFLKNQNVEMPLYTATPEEELQKREIEERKVWDLLRYRYDEKPQVWAEAYVYRELVEQASRTSQELGGYLDWSFENFYDLLNNSQKKRETYGEFAADVITQLKSIRKTNMDKLGQVEKQRKVLAEKAIYSKIYQFKDQEKMRQCFPYYINESTIPGQFRRSFLSVLDSTIQEFTEIGKNNDRKLLFKEELGIVDKWINKDIATSYTDLLKNDVEYVTSYLQILTVKDILVFLKEHRDKGKTLEEIIDMIRDNYNVDFHFSSGAITMRDIHAKIFSFLYFLMDMHTKAKKHIQSPQSKLIDFMNRLKQSHQQNIFSSLPYSFESLILMIAKDRRRIYDRFIGEQFISQPQFYLQHVTRQAKRDPNDILKRKQYDLQVAKSTFKGYVDKYSDAYQHQKKHLIQNYFYYMILFEKHIHEVCGKDSFIPTGFINQQHKMYNKYCQGLFRPKQFEEWLDQEIKVVVGQLLDQRYEVEKKLTKGELYLFDQTFQEKLKPESIRVLIQKKIDEEIYVLKNIFAETRDYDFQQNEEERSDEEYTRTKRSIVNTEALKKLNNLALAEEISLEYLEKADKVEGMSPAQRKFARNQKQYFKNGMVSRLPSRSYHRMARDLFVYPEEHSPTKTKEDLQLFKKTNVNFSKSASEKITLSNFTDQYKTLSQKMKDEILDEMVSKVKAVESL